MPLIALHFETANRHRGSACHVAAVLFDRGRVEEQFASVLRPPEGPLGALDPLHASLHGLGLAEMAVAPAFGEIWPLLSDLLARARRVVAQPAAFHRGVLASALAALPEPEPAPAMECVLTRARRLLPHLENHRLTTLCAALGLPQPAPDRPADRALAAARIANALDWLEVLPGRGRPPLTRRAPTPLKTTRAA
jgi:DNA polymerase-3 subunit epsilon